MLATMLLCALIASPASSDTIHVGDPLGTLSLPVGVDTVDNYVVRDGLRRRVVTFVQTITEMENNYLIIQENLGESGRAISIDSVTVEVGTLATIWHGDVTPMGSRHVEFHGNRMRGVAVDSLGAQTAVDEETPVGLFDYSLVSLVADRLPLADGYEATIATYDITRGPTHVTIRVIGAEEIQLGKATYDAWRMELEFGEQTVTRWTERSTGRELKWILDLGDRQMVGETRG